MNIISQLLLLADQLDKKKQFEEANKIDELLQKKDAIIPKKIDPAISLGYQPNEFDTVQQLQNV